MARIRKVMLRLGIHFLDQGLGRECSLLISEVHTVYKFCCSESNGRLKKRGTRAYVHAPPGLSVLVNPDVEPSEQTMPLPSPPVYA